MVEQNFLIPEPSPGSAATPLCNNRCHKINVRLQERRNQALKWELLRQAGTQETFVKIAKEVSMPPVVNI